MQTVKRIVKSTLLIAGVVLSILVGGISTLLRQIVNWMFQTWNHLTLDELIYQINAPIEGTNTDMIKECIQFCVPFTIIIMITILIVFIVLRESAIKQSVVIAVVLLGSFFTFIDTADIVWTRLDIRNYKENKSTLSYFIDSNYANPKEVNITFPEEKRNLIYIFLESMETTYSDLADGGAYEENYIPELTQLAKENEDFSGNDEYINGAYTMPGATWTMGGMFAQTAGLPLDIPIHGLNMDTQEHFFPELVTLGDILNDAGYNQTLFIGSDASFAGRKLYFTEHGGYAMKDYYYAINQQRIPEDYFVWWGYEDKYLFEDAKKELLELSQQGQPFNFTMLTVDTHFEDGYVCTDCLGEYEDNQYANVISCSSHKVMDFVNWSKEQEFYDNTTIVISGDHLTMDGDFCENIGDYERRVYTTYINPSIAVENPEQRREYTTFDALPTTLASLGVSIEGNRLGLGTNLFSSEQTLIELCGKEQLSNELKKESHFMNELAKSIDLESEELLKREGKLPSANLTVMNYDYLSGILQVVVSDLQNVKENVSVIPSINAAVWTEENQADIQWVEGEAQPDGSYLVNIYVPDFSYKTGIYYIDVYLKMNEDEKYLLGNTQGYVE